jgi:hypothetical protein
MGGFPTLGKEENSAPAPSKITTHGHPSQFYKEYQTE